MIVARLEVGMGEFGGEGTGNECDWRASGQGLWEIHHPGLGG